MKRVRPTPAPWLLLLPLVPVIASARALTHPVKAARWGAAVAAEAARLFLGSRSCS